jgi:hypothetical protein
VVVVVAVMVWVTMAAVAAAVVATAMAVATARDTVTVRRIFFSPPKTPPRHFHHQKFVCNDANIYISVALKIINTPVNRSLSLN